MALNIKDPDTDRLARQLARLTGESLTTAVRTAMEERLARVQRAQGAGSRRASLQAYVDRGRVRSTLDPRTADEIVGYDADGLPQ